MFLRIAWAIFGFVVASRSNENLWMVLYLKWNGSPMTPNSKMPRTGLMKIWRHVGTSTKARWCRWDDEIVLKRKNRRRSCYVMSLLRIYIKHEWRKSSVLCPWLDHWFATNMHRSHRMWTVDQFFPAECNMFRATSHVRILFAVSRWVTVKKGTIVEI